MFRAKPRTDKARIARDLAARCLRHIDPWAGRLIGSAIGLAGSWFGIAAGFVIGTMVDMAREGRTLRRYLRAPDSPRPLELIPGITAASALAQAAFWPGPSEGQRRREVFLSTARAELGPAPLAQGRLTRLLEMASAESDLPLEALERDLAQRGGERAQLLLATYAWTLAREGGRDLGHGAETDIVAALADSGCPAEMIRASREALFPGYRNPWEVLGLSPGARLGEIKRAWRLRSRSLHPDHGGGEGGDAASAFQSAREAYEFLKAMAGEAEREARPGGPGQAPRPPRA